MKYSQLDTAAKEHARNNWRDGMADDGWWDHVYTDVITTGALMGIEIGSKVLKDVKGKAYDVPDISFSGFWSQGDGASFGGYLVVENLKDCTERVKTHISNLDGEHPLWSVCQLGEELYGMIAAHWTAIRLSGLDVDCHEHLFPECTTTMRINIDDRNYSGFMTRVEGNEIPDTVEEKANELVEAFASYIYDQLEADHEHLTSDEAVIESIEANEPDFDEDGNLE